MAENKVSTYKGKTRNNPIFLHMPFSMTTLKKKTQQIKTKKYMKNYPPSKKDGHKMFPYNVGKLEAEANGWLGI